MHRIWDISRVAQSDGTSCSRQVNLTLGDMLHLASLLIMCGIKDVKYCWNLRKSFKRNVINDILNLVIHLFFWHYLYSSQRLRGESIFFILFFFLFIWSAETWIILTGKPVFSNVIKSYIFVFELQNSTALPHNGKLLQDSGELCSLYSSNPAKLAAVWCLDLCAETLFVLLLKFGAVLSIICGF